MSGLSGMSLRTRLVLFGTLVIVAAIGCAFALLSLEVRRQTRAHLADLLAQSQRTLLTLQKRSLEELLWSSRLMTESPTLRAAMETYEAENSSGSPRRTDLLATIQAELDRTRELLGKALAVITDARGRVLAVSPARSAAGISEARFESHPFLRHTLLPEVSVQQSSFALLQVGGEPYQIGCVPIVLQDFLIGTLTLGQRLDADSLAEMRRTLQSDAVIAAGTRILGSTLSSLPRGEPLPSALLSFDPQGGASGDVVRLGREEFVGAALSLGGDEDGQSATLFLLKPLSRDLASAGRSLLLALLACGALGLVLAGCLAWRVSRSILDPLERFVSFVRQVAQSADHSRRFQGPQASQEVRTLNQAFNLLMDSLQEHEQKLLFQAREEMIRVERLKESEKLASLGRMLSGAAHEINNPLTGVVGNLDILLRSRDIEGPVRERLERVQKEAHRIIALVRNLLKVAHRDTGKRTRVDLHHALREAVALRQHDFSAAGLELRLEASPLPLRLQGNEQELQQVFLNILNNAYDALKEGAREPVLTVRTALEDDQAVVIFEDGGPGLKDPKKVFDHFYTTKEIGKGTGLGLSITHAIVQSHRGRITAENRAEGGARFKLWFPLTTGESAASLAALPPQNRPQAVSLTAAILVVEDEPAILELQLAILGSTGATTVGVPTGSEAVALLERRDFDLIVSDVKLPGGVSGEDLFRWIEKHRPTLLRRVLFVTGDSASESTRAFLEKSGARCLMKPFSVEDYVTVVREAFDALRSAA